MQKEIESRLHTIALPVDFEDRTCDLAIETLADIKECDQSRVFVKWIKLLDKRVPLLYILFAGPLSRNMPKVHIDALGMHPAHAICLATMPSGVIMNHVNMRYCIRKGVEEFLLKHNVKGV